jgi:short-subunit dehydrogenase
MGGLSPTPYYAVYGATKAFVVSFSLALSEELKNTSVCVKVLCPGATETEFASVSNFKGADPGSGNLQTSEEVARETMRKISGNPDIIIPGFKNRVAACIVNLLPRSWTLKMAATSLAPREAA